VNLDKKIDAELVKKFPAFCGIYYSNWCTVLPETIHFVTGKLIFLFARYLLVNHIHIDWWYPSTWGHAVAQLVEALRGFDSRWCNWNFS
jgi:hypothetical protein